MIARLLRAILNRAKRRKARREVLDAIRECERQRERELRAMFDGAHLLDSINDLDDGAVVIINDPLPIDEIAGVIAWRETKAD